MLRTPALIIASIVGLLALGVAGMAAGVDGPILAIAFIVVIALVGGLLAVFVLGRRTPGRPQEGYRPDFDRLRPGRLRDGCIHVAGYQSQLEALAETLPQPTLRAALAADLPRADAALRAVYALCLHLQALELGDHGPARRQPVSADDEDAFIIEAEAELQATLDTFSHVYGELRQYWSAPVHAVDPTLEPLAALDSHIARLHDLAATFGSSSATRSIVRQES